MNLNVVKSYQQAALNRAGMTVKSLVASTAAVVTYNIRIYALAEEARTAADVARVIEARGGVMEFVRTAIGSEPAQRAVERDGEAYPQNPEWWLWSMKTDLRKHIACAVSENLDRYYPRAAGAEKASLEPGA